MSMECQTEWSWMEDMRKKQALSGKHSRYSTALTSKPDTSGHFTFIFFIFLFYFFLFIFFLYTIFLQVHTHTNSGIHTDGQDHFYNFEC